MEKALILSQMCLGGLMLGQLYLYSRFAKLVGRFLQKARLEPPVERRPVLYVGQQAPDFTATDQAGGHFDSEVLRGIPAMRLFTLPTCPICKLIVPKLTEVRDRFPRVPIIVVSSDEGGAETEGLAEGVTLIRSTDIRRQHAIASVPTLVVVDRNNRVIAKDRVNSFEDLTKRLDVYLSSFELVDH